MCIVAQRALRVVISSPHSCDRDDEKWLRIIPETLMFGDFDQKAGVGNC